MLPLKIKPGRDTPMITLDQAANSYEITGRSFPEDCWSFYEPVEHWISELNKTPPKQIDFRFYLKYISSATIISFYQIFMKLKEMMDHGTAVKVFWSYDKDDEDIRREGEKFAKITGLRFEFNES